MKIVIDIKTDNAAFQDNPEEPLLILDRAMIAIRWGNKTGDLRDSNGNTVGKFKVMGK